MIAQAITELNNKTAHCQPPVLDWHTPSAYGTGSHKKRSAPQPVIYYPNKMDINLISFLPALLPVALSPGASFTLAISSTLADGRRGLFRTLVGTALGIYTHALLIGFGITAVMVSSPAIFAALKIAGTLWLLWLGLMLLISGITSARSELKSKIFTVTVREAWLPPLSG